MMNDVAWKTPDADTALQGSITSKEYKDDTFINSFQTVQTSSTSIAGFYERVPIYVLKVVKNKTLSNRSL